MDHGRHDLSIKQGNDAERESVNDTATTEAQPHKRTKKKNIMLGKRWWRRS